MTSQTLLLPLQHTQFIRAKSISRNKTSLDLMHWYHKLKGVKKVTHWSMYAPSTYAHSKTWHIYTQHVHMIELLCLWVRAPFSLWHKNNKVYVPSNTTVYEIFVYVTLYGWFMLVDHHSRLHSVVWFILQTTLQEMNVMQELAHLIFKCTPDKEGKKHLELPFYQWVLAPL